MIRPAPNASITSRLSAYALMLLGVAVIVILLCVTTTVRLLNRSDAYFGSIATLSEFYQDAEALSAEAQRLFYADEPRDLAQYDALLLRCKEDILAVQAGLSGQSEQRVGYLLNMVRTFDERFEQYFPDLDDRYETYRQLSYLGGLIQATAGRYHDILVGHMRRELDAIRQLWLMQMGLGSALVALLIALGGFASKYFIRTISVPFTQLVSNINLIKRGDFRIHEIRGAPSEMVTLIEAFSEMAGQLKSNIDRLKQNAQLERDLLEQQNENLAIKNLLFETELKSLQAQINPHFLFNTLNMIAKRAYVGGDEETCLLMETTADLLRYGLDKSNKISTLYEELDCIRNYFFIQQHRFADRIEFTMDIEPDLPNLPIPAMVLEPLVENAIMHGIKDVMGGARVVLKAHSVLGHIHLHAEDNGRGMDAEKLEALLSELESGGESDEGTHIGLRNVYRRLKMYFGAEMLFSIESEPDCGTVVTLDIPLESGEAI